MLQENKNPGGALLSPEGVMMLFIAGLLDFLSIVSAILILAFGLGLLLGRIVYIFGFILIGGWQFFRSGTLPGKKGKGMASSLLKKFLKKHWKKLAAKVIPVIGDLIPLWTITVYSELKSS